MMWWLLMLMAVNLVQVSPVSPVSPVPGVGGTVAWIAAPDTTGALPIFRKSFQLRKPIAHASVEATALGVYVLSINGARVGHDILAPGWTDYRTRVIAQRYDVTTLVARGENVLGALVGPGWYASPLLLMSDLAPVLVIPFL